MAERERIEFMLVAISGGIVPNVDYCQEEETVVVESGWAHVVLASKFGGRETLRSYPAHVVSRVVHRAD